MPADRPPECPRCGYDLSGAVSAWTDRCPLDGVCPECGHAFAWANIFDRSRKDVPWLIEHARTKREFAARSLPTFVKVMLAYPYWKRVGVDARVRILPLIIALFLLYGIPYMIGGGVVGYESYSRWTSNTPFAMQMFGTPSEAQLWRGSIVNALLYGAGQFYDPGFKWWESESFDGSLLLPVLAVNVSFPLMFLILPVTRRYAKLRAPHFVRAALGGMLILFPAWVASITQHSLGHWVGFLEILWPWIALGSMLWAWWWWGCAIIVGWRVRRGGVLFFLLLVVSYLAASIVAALHGAWALA